MTVPVSSVSAAADALPVEPVSATPGDPILDVAPSPSRRRWEGLLAVIVLALAVAATVAVLVPLWLRPASGTLAP